MVMFGEGNLNFSPRICEFIEWTPIAQL